MNQSKGYSFFNYWDEKILFLTIICTLILSIILFTLFQTETIPKSNNLLPTKCDYNRERFFITDKSLESGLSVLTNTNLSIVVQFPSPSNVSKSLWIKSNHEIWSLDISTGNIYIMQSINMKIVNTISLATFGCLGANEFAYDPQAYVNPITGKLSGQVWATCSASNMSVVIDTSSYSIIGNIPIPANIAGTKTPAFVSVGPGFAFIVYYPNVWYLYSTNAPFNIVTFGYTPGNSAFAMTQVWRGNDNNNNAYLYIATTAPSIVQMVWNSHLSIKTITITPYPIQEITTSLNEEYLYVLFQINNLLFIYKTDGMSLVPGTFSAILSTPNSLAVGRKNTQLLITDSNSIYVLLIELNPSTGKPISGSETYIFLGTGATDSIRFVQQCPCHFCL